MYYQNGTEELSINQTNTFYSILLRGKGRGFSPLRQVLIGTKLGFSWITPSAWGVLTHVGNVEKGG